MLGKTASEAGRADFVLAIVKNVIENEYVTLIIDGSDTPTGKAYKVLSSAWPLASGSRVVVMKLSGTYVVIGKVGTADESGHESSYVLPVASETRLGGVKVGNGLRISDDGTLDSTGGGDSGYVLYPATSNRLGGVIVGDGLSITNEGVLSVENSSEETTIVTTGIITADDSEYHKATFLATEFACVGKHATLHLKYQVAKKITVSSSAVPVSIGTLATEFRPAVDVTFDPAIVDYSNKKSFSGKIVIRSTGEVNLLAMSDLEDYYSHEFSLDYLLP